MADVVVDGGPAAGQNAPPPVVRVADPLGQEVRALRACWVKVYDWCKHRQPRGVCVPTA
jgi:hypothetical protein